MLANPFRVFVLLLFSYGVLAQSKEYGSFKPVDQEIIYQKVFTHDSASATRIAQYYQTLPNVSNVTVKGDAVEADLVDLAVDYKKFQFSQMNTPSIIQTGRYSGKIVVDCKDKRYRVTVSQLQLTGDIGYKKILQKDDLTNYACKNSGTVLAQDWCRPNMLGLLEQAFTDRLQLVITEAKKIDSDW